MKETLKRLRPELTSEQIDRFCVYYDLLVDWNTRVNLTAITGLEDVANKHFIDSLAAEPTSSTAHGDRRRHRRGVSRRAALDRSPDLSSRSSTD